MRHTNSFGSSIYAVNNLLDGFFIKYNSVNNPTNSVLSSAGPTGWGWNLSTPLFLFANLVITSSGGTQTMLLDNGTGSFELWTNSGSGWAPNFPDNYIVATTLAGSAGYTLTYPSQIVLTFNSSGVLTGAVDRNGNTLSYSYTGSTLNYVCDDQGRYYHLAYTSGEQLASITRSQSSAVPTSGSSLQLTYYASGSPYANYLNTVTDAAGNVYTVSYTTANSLVLLQSVLNPDLVTTPVVFTYYPSGSTSGSLDYSGFVNTEAQDQSTTVSAQRQYTYSYAPGTDADGNATTIMTIVDLDNVTSVSRTTTNTMNRWQKVIQSVDSLGNQWTYEYNDLNPYLATTITDPNLHVTNNVYNVNGQLLSTTDTQGNTTLLRYADSSTNPLLLDLVTAIIQPAIEVNGVTNNFVTLLSYDSRGNLIQVQDPLGNSTYYSVNSNGWLTQAQDANGNVTRLGYTSNHAASGGTNGGNLQSVTSPPADSSGASYTATMCYDQNDNPISSTDPLGNTRRYQFDANHRPTRQTDPVGNNTQWTYSWLLESITVPPNQGSGTNSRAISLGYDVAKRINAVSQQYSSSASAQRVGATYNGFGTMAQLNRPKTGSTYSFAYDVLDRVTSSEDPMSETTTASYSTYCHETTVTTPVGIQRVTTNDSLCRLAQVTTQSENQSLQYDTLSRLTSITTGSLFSNPANPVSAVFGGATFPRTQSFFYDAGSRLVQKTFPDGKSVFYSFDKVGNLVKQVDVFSNSTRYLLLNDYRLSQVVYSNAAEASQTFNYLYSSNSLSQVQYPSSTNVSAFFEKDKLRRLSSLKYLQTVSGTTTNLQSFSYSFDPSSNITAINDTTGSAATVAWSYGYDWFDRLTSVSQNGSQVSLYTFDGGYVSNDNRATWTQTVGATVNEYSYIYSLADQITSRSLQVNGGTVTPYESYTSPPSYATNATGTDPDGRMVTRTLNSSGDVTTYTWSSFEKLNQFKHNGTVEELDIYGPDGLRYSRNDGTRYYTSGGLPLADKRSSGNVSYLQAGGIRGIDSGGEVYFYLTDHLGSVRATIDSTGAVQTTSVFDEFGNITGSTAPGSFMDKSLAFVGGLGVRNEPGEAGGALNLMGQRWYSSELGRFVNRDPIGFAGGLNRYSYANGAPTNFVDPFGLQCWGPILMETPIEPITEAEPIVEEGIGSGRNSYRKETIDSAQKSSRLNQRDFRKGDIGDEDCPDFKKNPAQKPLKGRRGAPLIENINRTESLPNDMILLGSGLNNPTPYNDSVNSAVLNFIYNPIQSINNFANKYLTITDNRNYDWRYQSCQG